MTIYISHTAKCTGWNLESIYEGTLFKKSARTSRFNPAEKLHMLDWDYKLYKEKPYKAILKHTMAIEMGNFELIMVPDYTGNEREKVIIHKFIKEAQKHDADYAIPVHVFEKWMLDYNLALPNANWYDKNPDVPLEYYDNIVHLLGGSPHSHIQLIGEFEKVKSIDGNQIFNMAIWAGKFWQNDFPKWQRPFNTGLTNEQIFKISVKNYNQAIKELIS